MIQIVIYLTLEVFVEIIYNFIKKKNITNTQQLLKALNTYEL